MSVGEFCPIVLSIRCSLRHPSSKDALIRVWDRLTLTLHRTFRGHEGPVNAVGLQSGRVVSASGDGKMILWDIESGERLRTFEGHDRGLACIEFKVQSLAVVLLPCGADGDVCLVGRLLSCTG